MERGNLITFVEEENDSKPSLMCIKGNKPNQVNFDEIEVLIEENKEKQKFAVEDNQHCSGFNDIIVGIFNFLCCCL
jgi:hypothetical protein